VPSPKVSFVQGVPEWEWTIGAGVYLDTIEKTIQENKTALNIGLKKRIIRSVLILAVLFCLIYFWSKRISSQIQKSVKIFSSSLQKANINEIIINPDDIQLQEFKDIAVLTDNMLTARKQAEDALKKSEEKYRLLIESQKDMVVKFDAEGRVQFVSLHYCTTFGKTQEELLGEKFMPFIHEHDQKMVADAIASVFKPPYSVKVEERAMTTDGWRWQEWHNTAILNKDNKVEAIVAVGRDIHDRKKAETALKKSKKQFQDLFNSINDLIYTQDLEGRFISVNPAMQQLFGYDIQDFLGHRAVDFMEPELQPDFDSRYLEVIKKHGHHEGIACYFKKNREKIYIEYNSSLVKPDGGEPYISGIGRDVTEKIISEKKVEKLQEQIVQSQKMESIGTLAGGIAHDFNN
ncbi:MAG: PAS domain S-box protein, partial [Desulfobacula sp.]|nr:PAS domain S-box protein [Desulfobacula sp.]